MTLASFINRRMFGLRWRWEGLKNKLYDRRHRLDTHQECFLNTQGLTEQQALQGNNVYRPFWRKEFFEAIESLDIDLTDYLFVDVGAGKGKLLLLASQFAFSEIIGVEYAPSLHAVAMKNIQQQKIRTGTQTKITSIWADALTWDLPNRPAVYFLYNPFDLVTTKAFFSRLDQHAAKTGLSIFMIYANLRGVVERQEAFASGQSLLLKTKTPRYLIYQSRAMS
jgi:hypothetical protein